MSQRTCAIDGCESPAKQRGWCGKHYARWRRNGDPEKVLRIRVDGDPLAAWEARVEKTETCWLWRGHVMPNGYGTGTGGLAHRWAWELLHGPIPEGMTIDHLCRVRNCVNPDHLEPVTMRENNSRGESSSAIAGRRDSCAAGHEYTEETLYVYRGKRRCRACARDRKAYHREYMREWRKRKKSV